MTAAGTARALLPVLVLLTAPMLPACATVDSSAAAAADRQAIERLEAVWHGSATAADLEAMLAEDFRRPMPSGAVWSKAQQVDWVRARTPAPGIQNRFDHVEVRLYGSAAVVTGMATLLGPDGPLDRNVFTDVYVKRDGRWRMVSAQRSQATAAR